MIITYDLKGYPQFVYTAHDFAERKARKQPDINQLANLLIRSIFEDGGLGRVLSIDEVTPGTPANGWTIRFTGETNGRTADPYIAIYDGEVISYNDDPSRQPRDLSEGLALALDFAAKKGQKNCTKSKPCGGSCIAKGKSCRIAGGTISETQKKAADSLAKGKPAKAEPSNVKPNKKDKKSSGSPKDRLAKAEARVKQIESDTKKQEAIVKEIARKKKAGIRVPAEEELAERTKLNSLLKEYLPAIRERTAATKAEYDARIGDIREQIRVKNKETKSIERRLAREDRNLYP